MGDADNIDRFDAYRIHEILNMDGFLEKDLGEKQKYVEIKLQRLRELLKMQLATKTAGEMWKSRIDFYIDFYEKLKQQLERSESIITD